MGYFPVLPTLWCTADESYYRKTLGKFAVYFIQNLLGLLWGIFQILYSSEPRKVLFCHNLYIIFIYVGQHFDGFRVYFISQIQWTTNIWLTTCVDIHLIGCATIIVKFWKQEPFLGHKTVENILFTITPNVTCYVIDIISLTTPIFHKTTEVTSNDIT